MGGNGFISFAVFIDGNFSYNATIGGSFLFDILIMEFLSDWHFSGGFEGELSLLIYIILSETQNPKPETQTPFSKKCPN